MVWTNSSLSVRAIQNSFLLLFLYIKMPQLWHMLTLQVSFSLKNAHLITSTQSKKKAPLHQTSLIFSTSSTNTWLGKIYNKLCANICTNFAWFFLSWHFFAPSNKYIHNWQLSLHKFCRCTNDFKICFTFHRCSWIDCKLHQLHGKLVFKLV